MSTHAAPQWNDDTDPTEPVAMFEAATDQSGRRRYGPATVVVLAVIGGLTLLLLALVFTHNAEAAESIAILAMLLGTGLAIGFRKRWTH